MESHMELENECTVILGPVKEFVLGIQGDRLVFVSLRCGRLEGGEVHARFVLEPKLAAALGQGLCEVAATPPAPIRPLN